MRLPWRALLFGLVVGIGSTIKVTYALSLSLLALAWRGNSRFRLLITATIVCAASALGFAAAAPYAVLHPKVLMSGLSALSQQYNDGQPPHSLPSYDVLHQAAWISRYFLELYGLVPVAALAAPFLLKGDARRLALGSSLLGILLFAVFSGKAVFYERNFAHGLVPMLWAAALAVWAVQSASLRLAAAAVLVLPMTYWSLQIALAVRDRNAFERFELSHSISPSERLTFDDVMKSTVPVGCETISVTGYNDPWTSAFISLLERQGFEPIARYRGRFSTLVTSTLHTYVDTDVAYFRCPDQKSFNPISFDLRK